MPSTKDSKICKAVVGRWSFYGLLALSLITVVSGPTAGLVFAQDQAPQAASPQEDEAGSDVLKSRVLQLPKGSYVEVRLAGGQRVEGRLGDVVAEGFMLQTVSSNRLTDRLVRFEEMQSVAPLGDAQPRGPTVELTVDHGKVTVGLVGAGVNVDLTLNTPAKMPKDVVAHVSLPLKTLEKAVHTEPAGHAEQ